MCCRDCCTCDCCDNDRTDNMSLKEFLDANDNSDSYGLHKFLTFIRGYVDPMVNDPDWYTKERLLIMFKELEL